MESGKTIIKKTLPGKAQPLLFIMEKINTG